MQSDIDELCWIKLSEKNLYIIFVVNDKWHFPLATHFKWLYRPRDKPGDARYDFSDGEMSLFLSGHSSFAEVAAVVFNPEEFTTMLWIKLLNNTSPAVILYSDWYAPQTFMIAVHYPYKSLYTWFYDMSGQIKSTYYLK